MTNLKTKIKEFLDTDSFEIQVPVWEKQPDGKFGNTPGKLQDRFTDIENSFFYDTYVNEVMKLLPGVTAELVEEYGGEDQGYSYYSVYKFTEDGESVFVQFDGHYYSHDGSYYDKWFFVTPKEVTVTQYGRE